MGEEGNWVGQGRDGGVNGRVQWKKIRVLMSSRCLAVH